MGAFHRHRRQCCASRRNNPTRQILVAHHKRDEEPWRRGCPDRSRQRAEGRSRGDQGRLAIGNRADLEAGEHRKAAAGSGRFECPQGANPARQSPRRECLTWVANGRIPFFPSGAAFPIASPAPCMTWAVRTGGVGPERASRGRGSLRCARTNPLPHPFVPPLTVMGRTTRWERASTKNDVLPLRAGHQDKGGLTRSGKDAARSQAPGTPPTSEPADVGSGGGVGSPKRATLRSSRVGFRYLINIAGDLCPD